MEFNINPEVVVVLAVLAGVLAQLVVPALDPKLRSKE